MPAGPTRTPTNRQGRQDSRNARPHTSKRLRIWPPPIESCMRSRCWTATATSARATTRIPIGFGYREAWRPVFHMSGFLGTGVPIFEIRETAGDTDMLVRNPALGAALALCLSDKCAALMRGHGSVAVGTSLPQAVFRAIYLEVNARLQSEAMKLGSINFLTPTEAKLAAAGNDMHVLRPWALWKHEIAK